MIRNSWIVSDLEFCCTRPFQLHNSIEDCYIMCPPLLLQNMWQPFKMYEHFCIYTLWHWCLVSDIDATALNLHLLWPLKYCSCFLYIRIYFHRNRPEHQTKLRGKWGYVQPCKWLSQTELIFCYSLQSDCRVWVKVANGISWWATLGNPLSPPATSC